MILSWVWRTLSCTVQAPFKACIGWHDHGPAGAGAALPPSQHECWSVLAEINSEAEFRWMHEQGASLNTAEPGQTSHRDRVYDALWTLVRHHGSSLEYIENKLRALGHDHIWLYPLPHDGDRDPDCPTVCRDAETREARPFSVGLVLGPESEALAVKRAVQAQGHGSLAECGFLELK